MLSFSRYQVKGSGIVSREYKLAIFLKPGFSHGLTRMEHGLMRGARPPRARVSAPPQKPLLAGTRPDQHVKKARQFHKAICTNVLGEATETRAGFVQGTTPGPCVLPILIRSRIEIIPRSAGMLPAYHNRFPKASIPAGPVSFSVRVISRLQAGAPCVNPANLCCPDKDWGVALPSSPRDAGVGRGTRRGVRHRETSSPRPSPSFRWRRGSGRGSTALCSSVARNY